MKKYFFPALVFLAFLLSTYHSSAQTWKWATGSKTPHGYIESYLVAADGAGNVYSWGIPGSDGSIPSTSVHSFFDTIEVTGSGGILVSTDSNGHYRWAVSTGNGSVYKIAKGRSHDIYLFGTFEFGMTLDTFTITSSSLCASFCARIDASGSVIWLKKVADAVNAINTGGTDSLGNAYICGNYQAASLTIGSTTLINSNATGLTSDVYAAKLDTSGNPVWAGSFGGDSTEGVTAAAVTPSGDICIGGHFKSPHVTVGNSVLINTTTQSYLFVVKYSSAGVPLWGNRIVASYPFSIINGLAVDIWGAAYIAGTYNGFISFGAVSLSPGSNMYAARYSTAGKFLWANTKNSAAFPQAFDIAADSCGRVWVIGECAIPSNESLFIFGYDSSSVFTDSIVIPVGGEDVNGIALDNKGNLYVGGDYLLSALIGTDSLVIADSTMEDLFIAKYSYPFCVPGADTSHTDTTHTDTTLYVQALPRSERGICLYPNPVSGENDLTLSSGNSTLDRLRLYDLAGRMVKSFYISGNTATISLSYIPAGIYLCKIYTADHAVTTKKLIITR